ncbi:MAG TPA: HWE histidine kinase domain-containing protein [Rhizomicrobium sp.]|nr:HWE histidine kinase domain-containing protein [Rhizomicrobium sp.]
MGRSVLEAAPTVLYVYDVQNQRSVFQNRRFGELLGHPPSTYSDASEWVAFIHDEDARRFPAHRERLAHIRAGEALFWEFRMRDASGRWRWYQSRDTLLSCDEKGKPLLVVGSTAEITEQKHAEEHKQLLVEEMRHRARNLVAIVQAIARMSRPKNQPEANKYIDVFVGRLLTLLNTGGIVLSSDKRVADLEEIARSTLAPFSNGEKATRVTFGGPSVALPERIAGGLALAFHELATNAVKYGALSVEAGSVGLTWAVEQLEAGEFVSIEWRENGGPPVSPPSAEGFGGMVIRQSVAREPKGSVTFDYAPEGLRCRFQFENSGSAR